MIVLRNTLFASFLLSALAQGAPEPVEFWYGHTGAAAQAISQLCDRFNASRTGPMLRCIRQGSYEQTLQKTVAAYRAGKSPALVEIYDVGTADMLLGQATHNVEQIMADHNLGYVPDKFVPALKGYYSRTDGTLAAQPFASSTAVLYSHRNALAAVGINEPPQTWEAFAAALRALKAHGDGCPAVSDFGPWIWLEQTSATQGSPVASQANGAGGLTTRYRFDEGSHPRLMADLASWYHRGWIKDQAATRSGLQTLSFANGDCALLLDSTGSWGAMRASQSNDIDVSLLPIYAGTQRHASVPGGTALWVMRGHSREEYAVVASFLDFVLHTDNQTAFSTQTGFLPVTQVAARQLTQANEQASAATVGLAALADSSGLPSPPVRCGFFTRLRLIWSQQLQRALDGRQATDQALHQAAQRGNTLLALFQETYRDAPQY